MMGALRRLRWGISTVLPLVILVAVAPAPAFANKYTVNRHEDQFHWGVASTI